MPAHRRRLALYGVDRPRAYVRLRGLWWLRFGCCPCCYSSPPLPHCYVCRGSRAYGPRISETDRALWRVRWERRTLPLVTPEVHHLLVTRWRAIGLSPNSLQACREVRRFHGLDVVGRTLPRVMPYVIGALLIAIAVTVAYAGSHP